MTERQLTFDQDNIAQLVNSAYDQLRAGRFDDSAALLERALELDVEFAGVTGTLQCAEFWRERQARVTDFASPRQRAEFLLGQWGAFRDFLRRIADVPDRCRHDIRYYVHSTALAYLLEQVRGAGSGGASPDRLIGHCYRAMGDYENALDYLERSRHREGDSAATYAELADCYSLINEARTAKIFFREAFFLAPDEIAIDELESPLIRGLVAEVVDAGIAEQVAAWLPVYAAAHGTFSVRRELRPLEYGRLKQAIFDLEKRLDNDGFDAGNDDEAQAAVPDATLPLLLNRYFWLMDHYEAAKEDPHKIQEVLRSIRAIAPEIYQLYSARVGDNERTVTSEGAL
jgi:tetratricopeptide (TPR) repeat protein